MDHGPTFRPLAPPPPPAASRQMIFDDSHIGDGSPTRSPHPRMATTPPRACPTGCSEPTPTGARATSCFRLADLSERTASILAGRGIPLLIIAGAVLAGV